MKSRRYYAKEYRPGRWKIISPDGSEVYDQARDAKDRTLIFTDEDLALQYVSRLNSKHKSAI